MNLVSRILWTEISLVLLWFCCLLDKFHFHVLSLLLSSDSPVSPLQRRLAVQADEPAAAGTTNVSDLKKECKACPEYIVSFFFFFLLPSVFDFSDFFSFGSLVSN